jgi:hypothetical protein
VKNKRTRRCAQHASFLRDAIFLFLMATKTYTDKHITLRYGLNGRYRTIPVEDPEELEDVVASMTCDACWFQIDGQDNNFPFDEFTPLDELTEHRQNSLVAWQIWTWLRVRWLSPDWRVVLKDRKLGYLRAKIVNDVPTGWRSSVIWKIAKTAAAAGCSQSEVASLVKASRAWASKHGDDQRKLQQTVRKAMTNG